MDDRSSLFDRFPFGFTTDTSGNRPLSGGIRKANYVNPQVKQTLGGGVLALIALVAVVLVTALPSQAQTRNPLQDGSVLQFENVRDDAYLAGDSSSLFTQTRSNDASQWELIDPDGDNRFILRNLDSGRFLDGDRDQPEINRSSRGDDALWTFVEINPGQYQIRNVEFLEILDSNGPNNPVRWDAGAPEDDDLWTIDAISVPGDPEPAPTPDPEPAPAPTPPATTTPTCTVEDGTLTWDNTGVSQYFIRQVVDGAETFIGARSGGLSFQVDGTADSYIVRSRVGGVTIDAECGNPDAPADPTPPAPPADPTPPADPANFACSVEAGVLSWNDLGSRYSIREVIGGVDLWVTTVGTGTTSFSPLPDADGFIVRALVPGENIDAFCSATDDPVDPPADPVDPPADPVDPPADPVDPPADPVDPPAAPVDPQVFTCSVDNGVLSWDDVGANSYALRQVINGSDTFFTGGIDGATTSFVLDRNADGYIVRAFFGDGVSMDSTECAGNPANVDDIVPIADFTCTVQDGILSWDNVGANSYALREIIDGNETFFAGVDSITTSFTLDRNREAYTVRAFLGGGTFADATCNGNPL